MKSFDEITNDLDDEALFELMDTIGMGLCPEGEKTVVSDKRVCKTCGSDDVMDNYFEGIVVCLKCGSFINGLLDTSAEWREFDGDNAKDSVARCSGITSHFLP